MAVQESSGASLAIATSLPATYNQAGYEALSWTVIGEVTGVPMVGESNAVVTHSPLDTIDVEKFPGSRNFGSAVIPMALDDADAGQTAAEGQLRNNVSFRIAFPDGEEHYFTALVTSFQSGAPGPDSICAAQMGLDLTKGLTKVAA